MIETKSTDLASFCLCKLCNVMMKICDWQEIERARSILTSFSPTGAIKYKGSVVLLLQVLFLQIAMLNHTNSYAKSDIFSHRQ